jgi:hypothetical protein
MLSMEPNELAKVCKVKILSLLSDHVGSLDYVKSSFKIEYILTHNPIYSEHTYTLDLKSTPNHIDPPNCVHY